MNLIRRSFSKHYCPECGGKVSRVKWSYVDRIFVEILFFVPLAFIWLVCAAIISGLGGGKLPTYVGAFAVSWFLLSPWLFALSTFRCKLFAGEFKHQDVICRGWAVVV